VLREWLEAGFRGIDAIEGAHALRYPWAWPHDQGRHAVAATHAPLPAPPAPGEVCLVSATATGASGTLWAMRPRASGVRFVGAAEVVLRLAPYLALRVLPLLRWRRALLRDAAWAAEAIGRTGRNAERVLDGRSFGVAMCLANASLLIELPVPADLCATVGIDDEGRLTPVDGLEAKIRVVGGFGLGLRRLVVHESQLAEAETLAARFARGLRVVGVRRLGDAIDAAFPALEEQAKFWWPDARSATEAARELFVEAVVESVALLSWHSFARAAALVGRTLRESGGPVDAIAEATFAEAIARRHAGEPTALDFPSQEWLGRQRRPHRLAVVAHVLQSAADVGDSRVRAFVDQALAHVGAPGDECAEDLRVLGAAGRALAAIDDYERARELLLRAVRGWCELRHAAEASRAVCELLRIVGVLGDRDGYREAACYADEVLDDPRTSPISRAYVKAAVERALCQLGMPEEALRDSDVPFSFAEAGAWLMASRTRWRARALAACGRIDEARALRERLDETDEELRPFAWLARLDARIERGERVEDLVDALKSCDVVRSLAVDGLSPGEVAKRYADFCRY
jgi:hypothetical protein